MVAHQTTKLTNTPAPSDEGQKTLGSLIRRLTTPLAMAYAATLHAEEQVADTQPQKIAPAPENQSTDAQPEAAQAQWRQWRQKFRGQIPTEAAGADLFAEKVRDLRFRVSEAATLELPLSFLIGETSENKLSPNEERIAPLLRHSRFSRDEVLKLATEAKSATQMIEKNEKEIRELEGRSDSLSPIMGHYERLVRRIEFQQDLIREHTEFQVKLDPTLRELRELEALHEAKSSGKPHDAARFKQLSRRIGLHSASEVTEARLDLERIRAQHEVPIAQAHEEIKRFRTEEKAIADLAFHEACENYDAQERYSRAISELSTSTSKLVKDTSAIRSKTVADVTTPGEREALHYELALAETFLSRREYTTLTHLGNTSTAFVFDRDRSNRSQLFIATNEPTTTITATEKGDDVLLTLAKPTPLHLREINKERTVRNYLDLREEIAFDDKGTVPALEPLLDLQGPNITLHLCPGSRFDLTRVRASRRAIVCEGGGTIVLGPRGQTPEGSITPRIDISTNRMSEPLVISIPKDPHLTEKHIDYDSFGIKLSLHADVSIATKTSRFGSLLEKPGADVDIEVRGTKQNVVIPLVRDGRPVFDEARKVFERIAAVE